MPQVTYISHSGETQTVELEIGTSVMEGAIENNIDGIVAECGGSCMCATCHVFVDEKFLAKLSKKSDEEIEMLEETAVESKANSRLSCQIEMTEELDGLVIHTPETQT